MVEKVSSVKTYQWEAPSLIMRMDVRAQDKGNFVAYIYPPENAPEHAPKLLELRDRFKQMGWATNSDSRNGKMALRVTGIANENQLLTLLKTGNHITGTPGITTSADKHSKGFSSALHSNSLRASGLFYMLGNILYVMSGYKNYGKGFADKNQIGMGVSFAVGDAALMAFGGRDDTRQFKSLLTKLKKHLEEKGIAIPEGAAINAETMAAKGGFLETTYDFLHEHINPIKIMAEMAGGALLFKSGLNPKTPNIYKKASGAVIMTGWTAALLIKEKKRDPEKWQKAGALEKAKMYIEEKPLRLAGWAGLAHNAIYSAGAIIKSSGEELKRNNGRTRHYLWDLGAVCSMLIANSLYAISNKVTGGSIETGALVEDVYGLAAQVLNRQPAEVREKALEETANYLGERTEIKDSREQIIARLRKEMDTLSHNPWFYPREQAPTSPGIGR